MEKLELEQNLAPDLSKYVFLSSVSLIEFYKTDKYKILGRLIVLCYT